MPKHPRTARAASLLGQVPLPNTDGFATHLRQLREYLHLLGQRINEDRIFQVAGSLTFTMLLALVPLVTVSLVVFSAFPLFAEFRNDVEIFLLGMLPAEVTDITDVIDEQLGHFAAQASKLTAVGLLLLFASAIMTLLTIENAFNHIWRVKLPRPLASRVLVFWTVLTLGPVLMGASLAASSYGMSISVGWIKGVPGIGTFALSLAPLLFHFVAFSLLYGVMPYREIEPRHAMLGGALAALTFEMTRAGFAAYITAFSTYSMIYGAFAAVPIFLLWLYLSWLITLIGAVITATLPLYRHARIAARPAPGAAFYEALAVLRHLYAARGRPGEAAGVTVKELRPLLQIGFEHIETRLEALLAFGWVARTTQGRWMLACDPANIRTSDIFQRFVFNSERAADRVPAQDTSARAVLAAFGPRTDPATGAARERRDQTLDQLFGPQL